MRTTIPIAIGLLLLAGCSKSDEVSLKNASVDQVAAARQAVKLQPGEWEINVQIVKEDMKGGPAGVPAMPKAPAFTTKTCLTPEQVEKPEAMFGQGGQDFKKRCTYDRFDMADGKVAATMHCALPQGGKVEASTTGTFTPTRIDSTSSATTSGMMPGMTVTSETHMTAHRVGDCTAATPKGG